MNTKEIASAVNKTERSVQRWVKFVSDNVSSVKDKMSSSSPMKPADFDIDETCLIIQQGLGKNAADIFRMNATQIQPSAISTLTDKEIELISTVVSLTVKALLPNLEKNVLKGHNKQLTFNDVPEKSKRAELREIINKYTAHRGCNHIEVWSQLYQQIYYRMNINVKLCADNRGMDKLDYIEKEGLLNEVLSLAKKLFEV